MSIVDILLEGSRDDVLYHFTGFFSLQMILDSNKLDVSFYSTDLKGVNSVSLTRNFSLEGFGHARIALDSRKLSSNYQIKPKQDPTYNATTKSYDYGDVVRSDEREETVNRPIKNLDEYIIQIDVLSERMPHELKKYSDRINLVNKWRPVKI